ncbi:MAG TPA: hypothetical protein VLH84_05075 [Patescibacteria group bacterium]|nr:hypothetical protein [Patescibacteria group bacterium]
MGNNRTRLREGHQPTTASRSRYDNPDQFPGLMLSDEVNLYGYAGLLEPDTPPASAPSADKQRYRLSEDGVVGSIAAIALMAVVGVAAHSLSRHEAPKPAPAVACGNTAAVTSVRGIGAAKDGGVSFVNAGVCAAAVYDPTDFRLIRYIQPKTAFEAYCIDGTQDSASVQVEQPADSSAGSDVRVDQSLITSGEFSGLPYCHG